ncbi:MAG: hypothetical protein B7Z16_03465 [Algoriphagus sp. 32-45-6]|nr:MAG: hypothetical protein B7Z16_03465 [Algoriphagus sp. 32-45-6]
MSIESQKSIGNFAETPFSKNLPPSLYPFYQQVSKVKACKISAHSDFLFHYASTSKGKFASLITFVI